jgi:hypothetical protein
MTAYFDKKGIDLANMERSLKNGVLSLTAFGTQIDELEQELVWDVTIATEFPGFPPDLATEVNEAILKRGTVTQPLNASRPSFETVEDHVYNLSSLVGDFHSIFHKVSQRKIVGFSDDPRSPLRVLYAKSEEKREMMVERKNRDAKIKELYVQRRPLTRKKRLKGHLSEKDAADLARIEREINDLQMLEAAAQPPFANVLIEALEDLNKTMELHFRVKS